MTNGQQEISGDKEEADLEQAEEQFREEQKNTETILGSADPRLEEAEEEFEEEFGSDIADVAEPKKEETAKENQQILAALGFKRYEDAGVVKYNIHVLDIKIGVTFNETNPFGMVWAYKIPEGDEQKEFLKNSELKDHPLIQEYEAIKEGKELVPETSVTGKILEKRGKAIKVEIEENGEVKEIFYGQGAVKKDNEGKYFIPAGFSKGGKDKEGQERDAKMNLPRDILLPDYLIQLSQVPTADVTKEQGEGKEKVELSKKPDDLKKREPQPTEKTTMDKVIQQEPTEYTESIAKYTNILAEVTEAILAEDRIPSREKGYGVKFVYYSVIGENRKAELSESTIEAIAKAVMNTKLPSLEKGGDHEE